MIDNRCNVKRFSRSIYTSNKQFHQNIMEQNTLLSQINRVMWCGRGQHEWIVYCEDLSTCFKTEKFLSLLAFGKILRYSSSCWHIPLQYFLNVIKTCSTKPSLAALHFPLKTASLLPNENGGARITTRPDHACFKFWFLRFHPHAPWTPSIGWVWPTQ